MRSQLNELGQLVDAAMVPRGAALKVSRRSTNGLYRCAMSTLLFRQLMLQLKTLRKNRTVERDINVTTICTFGSAGFAHAVVDQSRSSSRRLRVAEKAGGLAHPSRRSRTGRFKRGRVASLSASRLDRLLTPGGHQGARGQAAGWPGTTQGASGLSATRRRDHGLSRGPDVQCRA